MNDATFLAPVTPIRGDSDVRLAAALAVAERSSVPALPQPPVAIKRHVIIESPLAGKSRTALGLNQIYGRAALRDSLLRGEAPMASHLLYAQTLVLDDTVPEERELGMRAGFSWLTLVDRVAVYIDRGISRGMEEGIRRAVELGVPVEERSLPDWARG
jgi:hypothetical protein